MNRWGLYHAHGFAENENGALMGNGYGGGEKIVGDEEVCGGGGSN